MTSPIAKPLKNWFSKSWLTGDKTTWKTRAANHLNSSEENE
jgi:hypothetical protein